MKKIEFPFITLVFVAILVASFVLSQAIIMSQQSSIAEEEMRLESIKHNIFGKYFNSEFMYRIPRGDDDILKYSNKVFERFIADFLSSDNSAKNSNYLVHIQATRKQLDSKQNSFILYTLGSKKRANPVSSIICSATSLFLHLNILHLALLIGALWIIGINLEKIQGIWFFLLLTLGGVGVNLMGQIISSENILNFGFAPGISVALGAYIFFNYDEEAYLLFPGVFKIYGIFLLIPWLIIEAVQAVFIQTETYKSFSIAHIGGLFIGVILAVVFRISKPPMESAIEQAELRPIDVARRDLKMSNYRGAIAKLGDILRKDSTNEEALKMMLHAYLSSRNQQDCIGLINYSLTNLAQKNKRKIAFDLYMDFSSAHPSALLPIKTQFIAGQLLAENNFYEMAVNALTQVTQINPGSDESVRSVFLIGKLQVENLSQPQQAAQMFTWIVQNFPSHPVTAEARQMLQKI